MGKRNSDNLIPNYERTPKEREEIARKGGIASGEARRRKKTMREWAEVFGAMPFKVRNIDGSETETDYDGAVMSAIYQRAITEQDVRSAEFIAKLKGELEVKIKADVVESLTQLDLGDLDPEALAKFLTDIKR